MMPQSIPCPYCGEALVLSAQQSLLPDCSSCKRSLRVDGRYQIIGLLGLGAVSVVYEATRLEDGREVALKVLQKEQAIKPLSQRIFKESTERLERLHHAQMPEVYDFFRLHDGPQVLVLEALEGGTLHDRLFEKKRHLEPARVVRFFIEMLNILICLQSQTPPIIHRYIQPSNIMFRTNDDWIPILVDFDHMLNDDMQPLFQLDYMPPEQHDGKTDVTTDIYSLALTVLSVVTGKAPHQMNAQDGVFDVDTLAPDLLPVIRHELKSMLAPYPEHRTQSAMAVQTRVLSMLAPPPTRGKPVALLLFLLLILVLVVGLMYRAQLPSTHSDSTGVVHQPR